MLHDSHPTPSPSTLSCFKPSLTSTLRSTDEDPGRAEAVRLETQRHQAAGTESWAAVRLEGGTADLPAGEKADRQAAAWADHPGQAGTGARRDHQEELYSLH